MKAGMQPSNSSKQWIPFQTHALFKASNWKEYKPHKIAVFYVVVTGSTLAIQFPINYYYSRVYGFNTDVLDEELSALGFYVTGSNKELQADLKNFNSEDFFNSLFTVVMEATSNFEDSVKRIPAKSASKAITELG
jgi:hypothetical protein